MFTEPKPFTTVRHGVKMFATVRYRYRAEGVKPFDPPDVPSGQNGPDDAYSGCHICACGTIHPPCYVGIDHLPDARVDPPDVLVVPFSYAQVGTTKVDVGYVLFSKNCGR